MDENTPRISQEEIIELCKEAKVNAKSAGRADREYALVVLLQKRLGDERPENILSDAPTLLEKCEQAISAIFTHRLNRAPYFDVTKTINQYLIDDATE